MRCALDEFIIGGIRTNIPLHQALLRDPEVIRGTMSTRTIERRPLRHVASFASCAERFGVGAVAGMVRAPAHFPTRAAAHPRMQHVASPPSNGHSSAHSMQTSFEGWARATHDPKELVLGIDGFSYPDLFEPTRLATLTERFDAFFLGRIPQRTRRSRRTARARARA
jgi:hypothetical protein